MTERIHPRLDYRDDQNTTEEMDRLLDVKGAQRWIEESEEGRTYHEFYASAQNYAYIQGWLTSHNDAAVTPKNLSIAFRDLLADGILKPNPPAPVQELEPAPFQQPVRRLDTLATVKLRHAADPDETARLRSTSEIGKPVSPSLREEYKTSLRGAPRQGLPARWSEAVAVVSLNHWDELEAGTLKKGSPVFNELVARFLAEQS